MTPELAKALREAGLWEAVLIENAKVASKWREAIAAAYEDAARIAEECSPSGPFRIHDVIATAIRKRARSAKGDESCV